MQSLSARGLKQIPHIKSKWHNICHRKKNMKQSKQELAIPILPLKTADRQLLNISMLKKQIKEKGISRQILIKRSN